MFCDFFGNHENIQQDVYDNPQKEMMITMLLSQYNTPAW